MIIFNEEWHISMFHFYNDEGVLAIIFYLVWVLAGEIIII